MAKRKYAQSAASGGAGKKSYAVKARGTYYSSAGYKESKRKMTAARLMANARVSGLVGVEKKFVDYHQVSSNVPKTIATALSIQPPPLALNAIAVGQTASTRIGKQVRIDEVQVRGVITWSSFDNVAPPAAPGVQANWSDSIRAPVRCMLVLDTQCNKTAAPGATEAAQILLDVGAGGTQTQVSAMRNLEYTARYKTIADKLIYPKSGAGGNPWTHFMINKKNMNLPVNYATAGATSGDILDNAIYILFMGGHDVGIETLAEYHTRVRYYDA